MNKKSGFTLIELLAVIVILAIILLIATPIILNVIEDAREGSFKNSAGYLMKAAENKYLINQINDKQQMLIYEYENGKAKNNEDLDYKGKVPESGSIIITKDGRIGMAIYDGVWCAEKKYNEETINISKKNKEECEIEQLAPLITLIGSDNEKIEINTNYIDKGVNAISSSGEKIENITIEIKINDIAVDKVDTSILGEYEITYSVEENGIVSKVIRVVKIEDTIAPNLIIPEDTTITNAQVASFNLLEGVSVEDNSGENIEVITNSNLSDIEDIYEIVYTAEDSSGNKTLKTRRVTVVQKIYTFTGGVTKSQSITLKPGKYSFELWAASGGQGYGGTGNSSLGGKGGYSKGVLVLDEVTNLYIFVGTAGGNAGGSSAVGGWNGGGSVSIGSFSKIQGGAGGGATDIRLIDGNWNDTTSLNSRIIIAGGGSGGTTCGSSYITGGKGGGIDGERASGNQTAGVCSVLFVAPADQTSGYALGQGCPGYQGRSGGGGGYYGGTCGKRDNSWGSVGSGGSGFVPGHPGVVSEKNGYTFTETVMTPGINNGNGKVTIERLD